MMSDAASNALPRVLFVTSSAFNRITGGGITFSNLFRGWPAERLATVHNDPLPVTTDVCRTYYRLSRREIGRWPLKLWPDAGSGSEARITDQAATRAPELLRRLKTSVFGNAWPDTGHLSGELADWIEDFKPDVLYTILGTIGIMELVSRIHERFRPRLIVHFMDDWLSWLHRGGALSFVPRARMNALAAELVGSATARLAIGDAMADTYAQRYGVPFSAIQNVMDFTRLQATNSMPWRVASPARILYVGSIFDNAQASSLIDVAQAVTHLAEGGRQIRLDIYSPRFLAERFRPRLEISPAVRLHDEIIDDARFFHEIAAADVLILPVNFDDDSTRLIRYSMPTKLPPYLASGTPILVYGPSAAAQVAYARREKWGHIVDRPGVDAVAEGLTQILETSDLREALSQRAQSIARRNHDAANVTTRFQSTLVSASSAR